MMGNMILLLITGLCLLCTYAFTQKSRRNSIARQHGCRSPRKYPHKEPLLGLDLFFKTGSAIQGHRYLPELTRRYSALGNTFQSTTLGSIGINSIEPENLYTVFSSRSNHWGVEPVRLPAQLPFCGRGFITTDGALWEHSRSLLRPSFSGGNAIHLPTLERYLRQVLDRIPKDGSTVDLQPLLYSLYLDTATLFLFGESTNSLAGRTSVETQKFLQAFDHAMLGSGIRIALGPFKFLYPYMDSKWLESCATTHNFADKFVQKALEYRHRLDSQPMRHDERKNPILLHALAEQTEDPTALRNEILQALMASQETTAALISNVFFLLSRHPPIWQRLRSEVNNLGNIDLTVECLQNMEYLGQILNETLRLYPVFPQMNRIAREDTILPRGGGSDGQSPVFAPAGTGFDTSWYNLHRLKSLWGEDADDFKPDRWKGGFKPSPSQYMPFGIGSRSCLGRVKARAEASYVIVRMLQEFSHIESRDRKDWSGQVQLTAKNANGCKIALRA